MEPELAEREARLDQARTRFAAMAALLESNERKDEDAEGFASKLVFVREIS